jgi:hypothetical protein
MGKFNDKCESLMEKVFENMPAIIVVSIAAIILSIVLFAIYGDGRKCLRREPSTYILQNNIMTPIPGTCIEYATEGQ